VQAFLDEPLPIIVGTTRRDGCVQLNPAWYEHRDGHFWPNGGPDRGWVKCASRVKTNGDLGVSRTGISADVEHPFRTKSNAHFG
jgi:hypothetical protein